MPTKVVLEQWRSDDGSLHNSFEQALAKDRGTPDNRALLGKILYDMGVGESSSSVEVTAQRILTSPKFGVLYQFMLDLIKRERDNVSD